MGMSNQKNPEGQFDASTQANYFLRRYAADKVNIYSQWTLQSRRLLDDVSGSYPVDSLQSKNRSFPGWEGEKKFYLKTIASAPSCICTLPGCPTDLELSAPIT